MKPPVIRKPISQMQEARLKAKHNRVWFVLGAMCALVMVALYSCAANAAEVSVAAHIQFVDAVSVRMENNAPVVSQTMPAARQITKSGNEVTVIYK